MKNKIPLNILIITSGIPSIVIFLTIYLLTQSFFIAATAFITIFFTVCFLTIFFTYKLVFNPVYKKLNKIKLNIKQARDEQTFKISENNTESNNLDPIDQLNAEIFQLIKNKNEEFNKLKKLENFRREFLGNVSHELKTPIFNIQGYLHTLNDGALDDKNVSRRFIHKAVANADRLSNLVNDLLIISQLETGELKLEKETFDIYLTIKDVFEIMEILAKEKNISLEVNMASDKSFFVFADKSKIRQVLHNLILNSIKYGKQDGKTIVGCYETEGKITVEVTDNGIGIANEHIPRLFERFYRVDKSRSREEGGTGLGLSIVKHILEAHNQTVFVKSNLGAGTTFSFTLSSNI